MIEKGRPGKIIDLDKARKERRPIMTDTVPLRLPDIIDPRTADVHILSSVGEREGFYVTFELFKEKGEQKKPVTEEHVQDALRRGEEVGMRIVGQKQGDIVTATYVGKARGVGEDAILLEQIMYQYGEKGWLDISKGLTLSTVSEVENE